MTQTLAQRAMQSKCDTLTNDDLSGGPIDVTITGIRAASKEYGENRMEIAIAGWKPFIPCKTMVRLLAFAWSSDDEQTWVGKTMRLYRDPDVQMKGETTGGIRISHVSDIPAEKVTKLKTGRNKREVFRVLPLPKTESKAADDPVLNRHREPFSGAPKLVLNLSGKIAKAYKASDVDSLQKFESEIQSHPEEWHGVLNAFLSDVLETLAKGTE